MQKSLALPIVLTVQRWPLSFYETTITLFSQPLHAPPCPFEVAGAYSSSGDTSSGNYKIIVINQYDEGRQLINQSSAYNPSCGVEEVLEFSSHQEFV
jgi:hypothetical protein